MCFTLDEMALIANALTRCIDKPLEGDVNLRSFMTLRSKIKKVVLCKLSGKESHHA